MFIKKLIISLISKFKRIQLKKRCTFYDETVFGINAKVLTQNVEQVLIGKNSSFHGTIICSSGANVQIGNNSTIRFATSIEASLNICIGNNVIISNNVVITDNNSHPIDVNSRNRMTEGDHEGELWSWKYAEKSPVIIDDSVWIGRSAMILKGVTIGKGSIIAAGAIVTKDVPPFSLCYGNPAVIKKGYLIEKS